MTSEPVVIMNLRCLGTPRNGGFILKSNQLKAWSGDKAFEFKGTSGFMVTIDISSRDAI